MSETPDISPVLDRMFGPSYRAELRRRLLEHADRADDPAFAERLREAADGRRPLRSLLADPAFQAAAGLDRLDETEVQGRPGPSPAQAEELQNRLAQYRAEHEVPAFPSAEVLASFASDALERAQRTRDTIAADALTGWQGSLDRLAKPGSTDGDTDSGEPPRTHA